MAKIFRKVALERLSSPEQLDQLMQVTSPRGWLALVALIGLLAAALVWGFYGSIPTAAMGEGILIRQGGVSELVAAASGQVKEVLVAVGDTIDKGQVVARVRQEGLLRQIADTEARMTALDAEYRELELYVEEQKRLSAGNQARQRANLERSIATLEKEVELLQENLDVQKELLDDGLITQQTLLRSEQQINTSRDQLAAHRLELGGLELKRLETERQLGQQLETRRGARRDLELEQRELEASLEEDAHIVATLSGRVLELMVDRGDVIAPGTVVLTMELVSEELLAVLFVAADFGKQVRPGMGAQVIPLNVQREEAGYLLGEVTWVAEFPSTARGMERLLANQQLVGRLMAEGPPVRVDVKLRRDPASPSRYLWSSSSGGPGLEISSGTLTTGSVIVREDRPISLLVPRLREKLGV